MLLTKPIGEGAPGESLVGGSAALLSIIQFVFAFAVGFMDIHSRFNAQSLLRLPRLNGLKCGKYCAEPMRMTLETMNGYSRRSVFCGECLEGVSDIALPILGCSEQLALLALGVFHDEVGGPRESVDRHSGRAFASNPLFSSPTRRYRHRAHKRRAAVACKTARKHSRSDGGTGARSDLSGGSGVKSHLSLGTARTKSAVKPWSTLLYRTKSSIVIPRF
jgi:hypothetical protein